MSGNNKKTRKTSLNYKQKKFVDLYFQYEMNMAQAYYEVYEVSYNSARVLAWKLLNENHNVMEYVKHKQEQFATEAKIGKSWILRRLKKYIGVYDEIVYIGSLDKPTDEELQRMTKLKGILKASDTSKFMDMVNKIGGFYEPEQINITQQWNISFDEDTTNNNEDDNNDN